MRLLLDAMHSPAVAVALREKGHDVRAALEDRRLRALADAELLVAATDDGRAVVTEDVKDYAPLAKRWAAGGRDHAGLLFTHPGKFNRANHAYPGDLIDALLHFLAQPPVEGTSWVWWL